MTAFLQRLVTRAGVGADGDAPPVPAGAVRPRVAGRFEPGAAGPFPDEAHEAQERVRSPAPEPRGDPTRPGTSAVHRGLLVAPTTAVPPPPPPAPAPSGDIEERTPGRHPTRVEGARSGNAPVDGFAGRVAGPVAAGPSIAGPVRPAVAADAVDRLDAPSPAAVFRPERARDRRNAGEPLRQRVRPAPVPLRPAHRPAAAGIQSRSRAVEPNRPTAGEPVVHVTIGRVEIRTAPPRPDGAGQRPTSAERSAASALEDYLAGRAGGR